VSDDIVTVNASGSIHLSAEHDADDIVTQLLCFVHNEARMPAGLVRTVVEEIERLRIERDAAQALADQLARALLDGPFRGTANERRDRMYGSGWEAVHVALAAYEEARRD